MFVGAKNRIFVIAEAGSNWRQGTPERDLAMAKTLIEEATEAGADAVKFQTYRPETVYVANAGQSSYLGKAGHQKPITEIFADLTMPHAMLPELAAHCNACGISFMSTPFSPADFAAVDPWVAVHKIASYEISHLRLLQLAGACGKPLILSTGASDENDIAWAIDTFRQAGGEHLCLMQCTARYPAPPETLNLRALGWLARRFQVPVGLSDHSRHPLLAPVSAAALGAVVVEKHFTLHNRLPGPDHAFAVTPRELKRMVAALRQVSLMLGDGAKVVLPAEVELSLFARRGLQATRNIVLGEPLREGINLDILRPGRQRQGLHPRHLPRMEGQPAARAIPAGDGIQEGDWRE